MRPSVKERWYCPKCGERVALYVRTSVPPLCANKETHSTQTIEMKRDEDILQ